MLVAAQTPSWQRRSQAVLSGTVVDTLGARLAGATVTLLREGQKVQDGKSGSDGAFSFTGAGARSLPGAGEPAWFSVEDERGRVSRSGWPHRHRGGARDRPAAAGRGGHGSRGRAAAIADGSPVTVIDPTTIAAQNKPELEALRLVPGAQFQQTGARGGQTSIFVRGGAADFTKVLVDGVSVNDIGGGFDFAQIQQTRSASR